MNTLKKSDKNGLFLATLLLLLTFTTACEGPFGKNDDAPDAIYSKSSFGSGQAAFQATVYPIVVKNCVQCHGAGQAPMFASSSIASAYTNAKTVANFAAPASSIIATYAGNSHCGAPGCSVASLTQTMTAAITTWAAAESAGSTTTTTAADGLVTPSAAISYYTAGVTIPSTLPGVGTNYAIMRFPLNYMTPGSSYTTNGYFEMQVQLLSPTQYRITSPKLALPNSGVHVTGVHVMVKQSSTAGNGGESPLANAWNTINANVTPITISNPLPTASFNTTVLSAVGMVLPVLSTQDSFVIGFETLGAATTACQNFNGANGFEMNVQPVVVQTCSACHYAGGSGYGAFPMYTGNDTQLCADFLTHVNLGAPATSQIVENPQGQNGHPDIGGFNSTDITQFIDWIQTE